MKQRFLFEYLIDSLSEDMNEDRLAVPTFSLQDKAETIWEQKVFCILSSQFNSQRAASIAEHLVRVVPFFEQKSLRVIEHECFQLLSSPDIRYRFPKSRAQQISQCWFTFAQVKDDYHEYLRSFDSESDARSHVIESCPGIGLKQASMFLRNIGATRSLCVIDVHMLYYLRICHGWEVDSLTPARYLRAEEVIKKTAVRHGLELNVFDTVIWGAAKALKRFGHHV